MKTVKDYTLNFRHYGEITVPAGTPLTHQTATGYDEKYHFVNGYSWIANNYKHISNLLCFDVETYGINVPVEYTSNYGLSGLTLPVKYEGGVIVDGAGKAIIEAERNSLFTPLNPTGRDLLLKVVAELLNEASQYDKISQILERLRKVN